MRWYFSVWKSRSWLNLRKTRACCSDTWRLAYCCWCAVSVHWTLSTVCGLWSLQVAGTRAGRDAGLFSTTTASITSSLPPSVQPQLIQFWHVQVPCPRVWDCIRLLARDTQAKLALIVTQIYPSVHPSVCLSVRDSYTALRVTSHVDYRLVWLIIIHHCTCLTWEGFCQT